MPKNIYGSGEDYLETILILEERTKYVRSVDIAAELGFSKPSVSRAMGIIKENGYITVEPDGQIKLTKAGHKKANEVWTILGNAKKQYEQFGVLLDKARRKIEEAGKTIDEAEHRNDIIRKNLKDVETIG